MSRIYGVNANRTDINKTEYLKLAGNCKENKIQGGNCPMKKSRSFIHYGKVLLIFAILMLVPFTGCKNIFVPEPPATPEAAGSGGGITVTLRLFTGSARTVMPEYTDTGSLNWKITASQGETAVEASGEYPYYTLSLPSAGEWIFNVTGLNNEGDEIFTGSVSMEITGTTATVSIPLSPGSAMTTGTGKISLTLTVLGSVEKVMYKLDSNGAFKELTPGSDDTYTLEEADVPAGTHTLSLYFLDGDGTTLYMCKETVNVWGGMTSDQWINTGNSAYINDEGEFELTEDIITAFLKTMGSVVYVNGDSGSDDSDGVGSIFAPVASVSKAVEILRKANTEANYRATIMVSGKTTIDQEIEVKNGETLTVKGTGENASITNTSGRIFNITDGSLTLGENITLTGRINYANAKGGAVCVIGGKFTMEKGSTIADSIAQGTSAFGGGVYVGDGGTFTMNDGAKIIGCKAWDGGGAVCVREDNANFTMNGGVIGGSDPNIAKWGGGVYVGFGCVFTMNGVSEISHNKAERTGSTSTGIWGGGVCFSAITESTFTMNDNAKIIYNTCDGQGGGVYVGNTDSLFFINNNAQIKYNQADSGADNGGGVYFKGSGTFTVSGNPDITGNTLDDNSTNNVTLTAGKTITIGDGDLTGGTIGVTAAIMNVDTEILSNVDSAEQCRIFKLSGAKQENSLWWIGYDSNDKSGKLKSIEANVQEDTATVSDPIGTSEDLQNCMEASASAEVKVEITGGGNIDVDSAVSVPDGADVAIKPDNSNTVNITASGATTVFDVQDGGNLTLGGGDGEVNVSGDPSASPPGAVKDEKTLINISSGGTVTIADNANIQNNKAGRGVTVTDGTLIMTGGSIKGNTGGFHYGSGVYVSGQDACFEMSGGEISNNKLILGEKKYRQGTGVLVCNGATFTLSNNGKIIDNSGYEGVGVCVKETARFTMNGGEISRNKGEGTSGGVYLVSRSIMNMNGGTIKNNSAKNVGAYLGGGGVHIGSGCTFTGSTDPSTTASITENYVGSSNVDVYVQEGGNYNKGYVQVDAKKT